MLIIFTAILGFALLFTSALYIFQRKLIYFPSHYPPSYKIGLPENVIELPYSTPTSGAQVAFYMPPADRTGELPDNLWIFFNGNASTAHDWLDFIEKFPDFRAAFYLYDYPGYGLNKGKPTRASIRESSESAFAALAAHLGVAPAELEPRLAIFGHSLGAAAALEFAVEHPPRRIVLVSPFTSLLDMARRSVGLPLAWLAKDRFDNRARLDELAALPSPPLIHIFHGTADEIVPFEMGRELAARHPSMITFHPVENGDHNWIIDSAGPQIKSAMTAPVP